MILILMTMLITQEGDMLIKLPKPEFTNKSIEQCIEQRRSIRSFNDKALSLQEISNILWVAQTDNRYRSN